MWGIPQDRARNTIEEESEFGDFGGVDLCVSEPLCRMVGLPCVEKGADVGFGIRAIRVAYIGVIRHCIKIWVVQKGREGVALRWM